MDREWHRSGRSGEVWEGTMRGCIIVVLVYKYGFCTLKLNFEIKTDKKKLETKKESFPVDYSIHETIPVS